MLLVEIHTLDVDVIDHLVGGVISIVVVIVVLSWGRFRHILHPKLDAAHFDNVSSAQFVILVIGRTFRVSHNDEHLVLVA